MNAAKPNNRLKLPARGEARGEFAVAFARRSLVGALGA